MNNAPIMSALDLISSKTIEDDWALGTSFPYVTDEKGAWKTMRASVYASYSSNGWSHGNWFCGFWIGLLLIGYLHTRKKEFLESALDRLLLVSPRANDPNTHDIGFIFWPSAIPFHRICGEAWVKDLALRSADQLRRRLVTTHRGAYIAAWGPLDDPRGRRSSAIDTMANLPLLLWAAETSDDASFLIAAEAHARITQASFVRDDYSTFHAVEFELPTGLVGRAFTFQGVGDNSLWSRGQAWAIYGYVAMAQATGLVDFLTLAERLAVRYFERLGDESVPWWDFDDPAIPHAPRNSSAAAIVCSALIDLAALHPNATTGEAWLTRSRAIIELLCKDYLALGNAQRGILAHACYSKPHNDGVDSAVLFGDFYFAEALCKLALPGQLRPIPTRLTA